MERGDFLVGHRNKARYSRDARRNLRRLYESVGLFEGRLAAVHRVYEVFFNTRDVVFRQTLSEDVDSGARDCRAGFRHNLHALFRRVCALVELPWEVFDGEDRVAVRRRERFLVDIFHGGFAENQVFDGLELRVVNALYIVALEHARWGNFHVKVALQIVEERG